MKEGAEPRGEADDAGGAVGDKGAESPTPAPNTQAQDPVELEKEKQRKIDEDNKKMIEQLDQAASREVEN